MCSLVGVDCLQCILIHATLVAAIKIELITRILGEYLLGPLFRASNRVIGILVSPLLYRQIYSILVNSYEFL